jgi:hypothetical protein
MSEPRTFDAFSFVVGLLALIGAGLALLDQSGHTHVDGTVAGACLLLAIGLTGLTRAALRLRGPRPPG